MVKRLIAIGKKLPPPIVDNVLLLFPMLYRTKYINYESGINTTDLQHLLDGIDETISLEGNIIECGSNRCGTSSLLAFHLKSHKSKKKVFALDSFTGMIPEELELERNTLLTDMTPEHYSYNSYEYVVKKIKRLGLNDILIPMKGYFQETLRAIESNFCLGFIDCDLGESVKFCAEEIWPRLVDGGLLFFHDYGHPHFKNVKPVVDAFVKKYEPQIEKRDKLSVVMYYIKKKNK